MIVRFFRTNCSFCAILFILYSGCNEGLFVNNRINCEILTANRTTNEIRFLVIVSGKTRNEFGFLGGSKEHGATSLGCDIELSPNTTIEWEENDKKCATTVDMSKYIPRKHEIKSFGFIYKGDGKWDVIARSGIFNDSPEVKP